MEYLTKRDLETNLYGIERYVPGDPSTKDLHLAATSGTTTGLPSLQVVYRPVTPRDNVYEEWFAPLNGAVLLSRNQHMAVQRLVRTLKSDITDRSLTLDERDMEPANLTEIMADYCPQTLNGTPSRVLLWAHTLAESRDNEVTEKIKLVQTFGELLTPLHRSLMQKALPNAVLKNGYTFSGANYPTAECPHSNGERHHLLKGEHVTKLEIVEPDEDGVGEIIATTHELKNFRTGDLGKFDTVPCPCGESPTLVLYGRKDFDRIPILGAYFIMSELERILEPYRDRIAEYQMRLGEVLKGDKLVGVAEFSFVPQPGAVLSPTEVSAYISRTLFVTKTRTFGEIVEAGIFAPLTVLSVSEIKQGKKRIPLRRMTSEEVAGYGEPDTVKAGVPVTYLTKHDLEKRLYGIEQYTPGDVSTRDLHFSASSGTTSGLPMLLVVHRPIFERDGGFIEWFAPLKSVIRFFHNRQMAVQHSYRALMTEVATRYLVLDTRDYTPEHLDIIMQEFKPETVNGLPSLILSGTELLHRANAKDFSQGVELVQTVGELLTPFHRTLLKREFPHAIHRNLFMFAGANFPCAECPHSNGERHHLLKGEHVTKLEIVEPDEDGVGEIIATTHELKNFRTGDLGKFDTVPCPCGESPTLVLYGRKDFDRIPILGAYFIMSELERILEPYRDRIAEYQMRLGEVLKGDKLVGVAEFSFVPQPGAVLSPTEVSAYISRTLFVTKTRTFGEIVEAGIFAPLTVLSVSEIKQGKKRIPLRRMTSEEVAGYGEPDTVKAGVPVTYLTKHDLEKRLYGIEQYTPGDVSTRDLHLAASSGTTTGLPSLLVVHRPVATKDAVYTEWFEPLKSTVRVTRNQHMSVQSIMRTLTATQANRVLVLDEQDIEPHNLAKIMAEYKPDTLNGPPSRLLLWMQRLSETGNEIICDAITHVQIFGELLTPLHRSLMQKALPNAVLKNGYMFSGANCPTAECPHSNGERHHLLKGEHVTKLEIVEPDEDGVGEIIATTHELKNFRTGDLGKFDTVPCPCGESPTLVLYGRKDFDRIPILGAYFIMSELERILEPYRDRIAEYQMRLGEVLKGDKLVGVAEFSFVPQPGAVLSPTEVSAYISRTLFVTKTRTFGEIVDAGIFAPLTVLSVSEIKQGKKRIPLRRMTSEEVAGYAGKVVS